MDKVFEFFMEKIFFPFFVLFFIGVFFIFIPAVVYSWWKDSQSPTFELRKDDWVCSAHENRAVTTYIMAGKVMVPSTSYQKYCTQWSESHE